MEGWQVPPIAGHATAAGIVYTPTVRLRVDIYD